MRTALSRVIVENCNYVRTDPFLCERCNYVRTDPFLHGLTPFYTADDRMGHQPAERKHHNPGNSHMHKRDESNAPFRRCALRRICDSFRYLVIFYSLLGERTRPRVPRRCALAPPQIPAEGEGACALRKSSLIRLAPKKLRTAWSSVVFPRGLGMVHGL